VGMQMGTLKKDGTYVNFKSTIMNALMEKPDEFFIDKIEKNTELVDYLNKKLLFTSTNKAQYELLKSEEYPLDWFLSHLELIRKVNFGYDDWAYHRVHAYAAKLLYLEHLLTTAPEDR
jgi:hypothetical protein